MTKEITTIPAFFAHRFISMGEELALRVLNLYTPKEFFLLSKIRVTPEESDQCKQRYLKAKIVDGIIKILAVKLKMDILYLYKTIVWPLNRKYNNAYNAFNLLANGNVQILKDIHVKKDIKNELMEIIINRLSPKPKKIRSIIKLTCFNFYGIDAIKESLLNGENKGTESIPIKFKIIGSPLYEGFAYAIDENEGIKLLNEALSEVQNTIQMKGGTFEMQKPPSIFTENDNNLSEVMKNSIENLGQEKFEKFSI